MILRPEMADSYARCRTRNAGTPTGRDTFALAEQWADAMEAQSPIMDADAALRGCPIYPEATGGMVADARVILICVWAHGHVLARPRVQA